MKIESIKIKNYLGAIDVNASIPTPIALFCGSMNSGKSSINEAVRLALTGSACRVSLKKDYANLVTDDKDHSEISVIVAGHEDFNATIGRTGKLSRVERPVNESLIYALDAQRFGNMADNDKRKFLLSLSGIKTSLADTESRLVKKGCDRDKVIQIMPILRNGFEAAQSEASAYARDLKSDYKSITGGEVWGESKGGNWNPDTLDISEELATKSATNAKNKITEIEKLISEQQQLLGAEVSRIVTEQKRIDEEKKAKIDRENAKQIIVTQTATIKESSNKKEVSVAKASISEAKETLNVSFSRHVKLLMREFFLTEEESHQLISDHADDIEKIRHQESKEFY